MSVEPASAATPPARPIPRRRGRLNFTVPQLALFGAAALVGLAALSAAGVALGLALAGAGALAVLVLAAWVIGANLAGMGRRR